MLLYIHGFGSSAKSGKAMLMRERLGEKIIAPSLSPIPELAIDTLDQIAGMVQSLGENIVFAGSSLGGYYATYLADKYNAKAVLINPSVKPYNTLSSNIGFNHSYYDFSNYEFTQKHIEHLKTFDVENIHPENFMLLLQTGDDVLDYREAVKKFRGAQIDIEEGGSHGYEGFERKIEKIIKFLELD
jgi:predicted esterase YcpF (UPF0227 family)